MKNILIIILCLLQLPAFATEWLEVKDKRYLDIKSIQPYLDEMTLITQKMFSNYNKTQHCSTNKYSFWEKSLNDDTLPFKKLEKTFGEKIWYYLSLSVIDCDAQKMFTKSIIFYDLSGNYINHIDYNDNEAVIGPFPPNSLGSTYYEGICKPSKH